MRRTDTIATIADEFDVTPAELRKWNHLRADHVARGMSLRIYPGGMTPAPPQQQAKTKDTASSADVALRNGAPKKNFPSWKRARGAPWCIA